MSRAKPSPTSAAAFSLVPSAAALFALLLGALPALAQAGPKPVEAAPPAGSWIKPAKAAPKKSKEAPAAAAAKPAAKATPAATPAAAAPVPAAPAPAPEAEPRPAVPAPAALVATPAPAPAPPPAAPVVLELPAPLSASDDFDLLAPAPVLDPAQLAQARVLEEKLATRRAMLTAHQIAGFVNLAGVATATVLGQLNYSDKYAGGGDTEKYRTAHKVAAYSSAGIFAATGLLALLAPSPIDQPTRLSTATVHKTCMAVATAGMVAQVVLGVVAASKNGSLSQRDFALAHQVIGYTTAAATAGGFIAIVW